MKRIAGAFLTFLFGLFSLGDTPPVSVPLPSPSSEVKMVDGYAYSLLEVTNVESMDLFGNFDDRLNSTQLVEKHGCDSLINAGFYDKRDEPIGWFVSRGFVRSNYKENVLFNGVIYSESGDISIAKSPSELASNIRWAVQSGPILILDGKERVLKIKNDKPARRMFAALDDKGSLYFGSVFDRDSLYQGPYLEKMPELMDKLGFVTAINLDGGSASAMITDEIKLIEAKNIGSFFCVKE